MSVRFLETPLAAKAAGDRDAAARAQAARTRPGALAAALIAEGAASPNVPALLAPGALAVTSGQQAGLFTGPMYAVLKALSAAALAQEMSAVPAQEGDHEGRPSGIVPVFWVAGDDHDFAEINHCHVTGADGRPVRIVLRERDASAKMLPAFREPVGPEGAAALAQLEAALPPGDARTETIGWLARHYTPDRSVAEAHARAMAELLAPYGVVVARGWSGELKRAAAGVMAAAAKDAQGIDEALAAHAAGMSSSGVGVPVPVGEGLSLLMVEGAQGRDRLKVEDGRLVTRRGNEAFSHDDIARLLADDPERLSANVLLRPVVEAAVFPTVGYFGGPGELAYLEQTAPVFQRLGIPRPARLPRLSGMLVEAKVDKTLEKYGLAPADLAQSESALAGRIAREGLPPSMSDALAALRATITERYATVQAEVAKIDATLAKPAENARNQALMGSQEIEKKLVSALKRTAETAIAQVARARDQLYPDGQPQERVISTVSFLARHGRPVLDLLYAAARAHAKRMPGR